MPRAEGKSTNQQVSKVCGTCDQFLNCISSGHAEVSSDEACGRWQQHPLTANWSFVSTLKPR